MIFLEIDNVNNSHQLKKHNVFRISSCAINAWKFFSFEFLS